MSTGIEWTEATWNPVVGCSIVSPGCTNCYAMRMAARIEAADEAAYRKRVEMTVEQLSDPDAAEQTRAEMNNTRVPSHYSGTTKSSKAGPVWTGKLSLAPERILTEPLRRKKPTMYFVNSMSDLFHEDVPDAWIDRVFAVMALTPQHTFQVLTKRSARMRDYLLTLGLWDHGRVETFRTVAVDLTGSPCAAGAIEDAAWPLPNVWLGVSCERQQEADARIPDLLATPAAVRFVSAEPLLGPIALGTIDLPGGEFEVAPLGWDHLDRGENTDPRLDWIIVGGESGANARPMHPDWARSIRDQCVSAGVPFFFKQWGEWAPGENVERQRGSVRVAYNDDPFDGIPWSFGSEILHIDGGHIDDEPTLYRVGKREAGRLLDGRTWDQMPGATTPAQRTREPA